MIAIDEYTMISKTVKAIFALMKPHIMRRCHSALRSSAVTMIMISLPMKGSSWNDHVPEHAETVFHHAKSRREERLAERHSRLAALRERREYAVGLGFVLRHAGQAEAFDELAP
jgi:hypothetical protein